MKMKKIALLIILLASTGTLSAQWYVTPEAGMISVLRDNSSFSRWNGGWRAGVGVEYRFNRLFSLTTGIHHMWNNAYSSNYYLSGDGTWFMGTAQTKHIFWEIPLIAKFSWEVADEVRLHAGIGHYFGITSDYGSTGGGYYGSYDGYGGYGSTGYYQPAYTGSVGLIVSAGLEVKKWEMNFQATGNYTLSLSLGYKFKLGKK
jgi:hypothetical protein